MKKNIFLSKLKKIFISQLDNHLVWNMREGNCHLCGSFGQLSFEHVPPRGAFNKSKIRSYTFRDVYDAKKGIEQQKGAGDYTLCRSCNNNTGTWYAPSYIDFSYQIASKALRLKKPIGLSQLTFKGYPLRILKQVLTMFFSLNGDKFSTKHESLKNFVLSKELLGIDEKYKILSFINLDRIQFQTAVLADVREETLYSIFSFFPLTFALCLNKLPSWGEQAGDISEFAKFNYNTTKEIVLKMPYYNGPSASQLFPKSS